MVSSVLVGIEAKDKNLSENVTRLFKEVTQHRYQFDRQLKEAETLRQITRAEW